MGSAESTSTFTPWGSQEQRNLLDTTNTQYKQISDLFPGMLSELQKTYSNVDPQTSINAQRKQGQQALSDYYTPLYRGLNQANVANFGGMNNSVGRDISSELGKQETSALSKLETGLQGNLYNMQQRQYQNALTNLGLQTGYGNYLQNIIRNSPYMAPVTQTTTGGSWTDWIGPAISAAGTIAMMSDRKTKQNIKKLGELKGINIYEFEYKPEYNKKGGKQIGVIAQEIEGIIPDAVKEFDNIKYVDYSKVLKYIGAA